MIELSITEIITSLWALVATAFWYDAHNHRKHMAHTTVHLLRRIAEGKMRVVETSSGFDFEEIK